MTKTQKIWLAIFLAMFLVPEVLWGALLNAVTSVFGSPAHSIYYNLQAFDDQPILAYIIILTEIIAIIGLLIVNYTIQYKNKITKIVSYVVLALLEITLIFILLINYMISHISFP